MKDYEGGKKKEKEENIVKNDFDNFNEPFKSLNR